MASLRKISETGKHCGFLCLLAMALMAGYRSRSAAPPPGVSLGSAFQSAMKKTGLIRKSHGEQEAKRLALYGMVAQAFYGVLSVQREQENLRVLTDLTQKRIGDLQSRASAGRGQTGELSNAQTDMASLQAQLQVATVRLSQERETFHFVTGISNETALADDADSLPEGLPALGLILAVIRTRADLRSSDFVAERVRHLHGSFSSLLAQVRELEKTVAIARKAYHDESKDYSNGLVTDLEVLGALDALQLEKRNLDRTRYQALSVYASLQAATGQIPRESL